MKSLKSIQTLHSSPSKNQTSASTNSTFHQLARSLAVFAPTVHVLRALNICPIARVLLPPFFGCVCLRVSTAINVIFYCRTKRIDLSIVFRVFCGPFFVCSLPAAAFARFADTVSMCLCRSCLGAMNAGESERVILAIMCRASVFPVVFGRAMSS